MERNFKIYGRVMLGWVNEFIPASQHQELIPYLQLLRPLSTTNWGMVISYPDEDYRI